MMRACVLASHRPPKSSDDPVAKKYCFRATVRVLGASDDRPRGMFTAFDASMRVATAVEECCRAFVDDHPEVRCEDVELVLMDQCPVELDGEIYYATIS